MKTVTEQQKKDFREEQKYITLAFSGGATLTNNDIVLDSMRITRTLCDSEQISFNTVYASEFSIQIFNDGRKYDGQTVTVSLTAGTYSVNLGTYTVVSNPRSNDRLYRTLTAYDSIAEVLSTNYADWHNGLKNNAPTTIGAYRTAFFNHIGITQESTALCNDSTVFKYAETTGALSGATILGELCSINGTFGYLDFDQTFRWVTPYIDTSGTLVPSLTLYPSTTLYPADVDTAIESLGVDTYKVDTDSYDLGGLACEEFITHNITQVYMHQGDVVYVSGTEGNRLTFTNTMFTMEPNIAVQAVANVRATVKDFNYTPTSVTMLATPWLELCDVVVADVSPTEKVYFPVLNFVINGTGAIRQTIEAKGVRVNSDEATNTDYKIITASNSADYAAELARQAQQAANDAQTAADSAQQSADDAQASADQAIDSVPGINLSPFFSHRLDDIHDVNTNPNGYWVVPFEKTVGGAVFEYSQLEDGWLHVHIDGTAATTSQRYDVIWPVGSDSIAPGSLYTFLMEFRNNTSTGAVSGSNIYLTQTANTQFWGMNVDSAPAEKIDGVGNAVSVNLIEHVPQNEYCFNRSTKISEEDDTHGNRSRLCRFVTMVGAGAVLDYDVRISLYEGTYKGPYVPFVVSDTSSIRETADEAYDTVTNMDIGGRNLLRGTNLYILSSTRSWNDAEWGIASGGDGTALVSDITDSPVAGVTKSFSVLNNTTGNRDIGQTQVPVNVGDEYTISGYVRLTNGTTEGTMLVRYYTTSAQIQLSKAITNTEWEYFKVTGTIKTIGGSNSCQFGISGAGSIEYCAVKMEDGNMPTSWSPAPEDVDDAITELQDELASYIDGTELIVGTQTAATAAWTGVAGFESLEDQQQITYWLPYAGVSGSSDTLNLTLKNGETTGPIPVYYRGSTRATTHFPAGSTIRMTYMMNANVDGTTYTGWWCDASYDSGNTYNRIRFENTVKASVLIGANRLIVGKDGVYFPLAASTPFDITMPILYAVSEIKANETGTNNYIAVNTATLRNNASGITLTQYATCYIVGTLAGNVFTPKAAPFFTSTVPTTNDGYYYISLGYLASTYQIYLYPEHPIYKFVDGSFKSLNQVAYEASVSATDAQQTADTAQETADNAQTAADNAQSTADTAQETAETAQQTAEEAMATYGTCSTGVGTAEKAVTCDAYNFRAGSTIKVFFATASNVAVPTLNINGQGAKDIRLKGQALSATANPLMWAAKTYITFIYDGTHFNVVDTPGTYTITCQATAGIHTKETDTMYNAILMNGTTVNVFFTNAYPTSGNLMLKFDSTSARKCFYGDAEISATNPFTWTAGTTISFALEAGFWYVADSGATEKAIEAGRTATNYLYMSTAKGLVISRSPVSNDAGVEALTAYNSRVVSDGFDVYRNGTVRTAHFGANTIVGESGKSQMHIDSTSMKFKDANGEDNLSIENNLTGQSSNVQLWVEVDPDNKSYRNTDGSLNHTRLATLISGMIDSLQMKSTTGDYVPNTTGIKFYVDIVGWVENDPVTGSYSPMYTQEMDIGGTNSITNGVLTHTAPEMAASDFTEDIAAFDDNFAAGSTGYVIMLNYRLYYPILNIAMTIGTRKTDGTKGAGSFSVGRNNEASGTGAVTLGKDLTMTSDYGVAVGVGNNLGISSTNDVAFEVGCGENTGTGFAVMKSGNIVMSSVNSGRFNDVKINAESKSEFTITFQHPYPSVPFVFLTLNEDNIPENRVGDYSLMQIFIKEVDNEKFTATIVNGSTRNHTFGFSWFAICAM